ncbi:unnamed protein product [Cylicocyclus nassatus]|uniref:Uncharacterized protein n=1 Tax=Cylicocyclus nassatus TaxID=53992 RepID=A0AA36HCX5_CYLNA|nr:unnamed protein product [Cylicocyclus nassatus]
MFSQIFDQIKEGLADAANQPAQAPSGKPAQQGEGSASGGGSGDFLSGLINVAKEVGSVINEDNKTPAPPPEPQQNPGFKQEDIAMISKGIGALVNTLMDKKEGGDQASAEAGKAKLVGAQATETNEAPGAGGDFLGGLMNVAKDAYKAMGEQQKPDTLSAPQQQPQSQLGSDDISKFIQGLAPLVGKAFGGGEAASEKAGGEGTTSVAPQQPTGQQGTAAEHDFLNNFLNIAKEVGMKLTDQQGGQAGVQPEAAAAASHDKSKVSTEDYTKLLSVLGPLVGSIASKTFSPEAPKQVEEEVAKLDAQGGKVQVPSMAGDTAAKSGEQGTQAAGGSDFLSGLMNIAKDLGKAVNEPAQSQTQQTQQGNHPSINQDDIAKITAGLGTLGMLLKDKFQKPDAGAGQEAEAEKKAEKPKEQPKHEPVIDDVEGEIGRVHITGYTGEKKKE